MSGDVTRIRILEAGLDLASAEGLSKITFGSVARHARLSKGGVVGNFSHISDLKRGIIDLALDHWSSTCLSADTNDGEGMPSLLRYLNVWIGWTRRAGLRGSCPIAQAIVELSFLPGPVRQAAAAAESVWRQTLIVLIRGAMAERHISHEAEIAQFAWDLVGIYLSHHVSSHSLHDPNADKRAHVAVSRIIASMKVITVGPPP